MSPQRDRATETAPDLLGEDFFSIVESSPDFVALAWLDNRVAYVNPAGRRLVGLASLEEAIAHPISAFLTEEGLRASIEVEQPAVVATGEWHGRGSLRHFRTGEAIPVEITSFLVTDRDGNPRLLATFQRDIRSQLVLESQLRRAETLQTIGRFATTLAHDLNNVLMVVLGTSAALASGRTRPEDAAATIEQAARQGADLVRGVLQVARDESSPECAIDLNEVVSSNAELLHRMAPHIDCRVETSPAPAWAGVSRAQLGNVLLNLCANARDALDGHPDPRVTLRVRRGTDDRGRSYVKLVVTDNGRGMDATTAQRAFDPFFTTKGAGTGIGLASVREVSEAAGGQTWIESTVGGGTSVTVAFPELEPGGPERPPADRTLAGTESVLIVDDDARIRSILEEALAVQGYRVTHAADGATGLELTRTGGFDVVVVDVGLPALSGDVLARFAAQRDSASTIVLMTGDPPTDTARRLVASGRADLLSKPFLPVDLLRTIRRARDAAA